MVSTESKCRIAAAALCARSSDRLAPALLVGHSPGNSSTNMHKGIPDFFIVGAPKCGTSALFTYLSAHPSVFVPRIKEPSFFCPEFGVLGAVKEISEYVGLFAAAHHGALTGEASVLYLLSEVAVPQILAMNPRAKFIAMLRQPIEAARSLHLHNLHTLMENEGDFREAWIAQADRARGVRIPPTCTVPVLLQYGRLYRYAQQIDRIMTLVPPAQRCILIYEEFFSEPARYYPSLLEFLGLTPDNRSEFPVVNSAQQLRSRAVAQFMQRRPAIVDRAWRRVRGAANALNLNPRRLLTRLNERPAKKLPLGDEFLNELVRHFSGDIAALEGLLGRRIELWN